jgi:hypothetical protein
MDSPKHVEDAKFIYENEDVKKHLWPRDIKKYNKTRSWKDRMGKIRYVTSKEMVSETIKRGEVYNSISNSITFVRPFDGVALYVIVSSELEKNKQKYPKTPDRSDFKFNAVSVWIYIFNENKASKSDVWTAVDLAYIKQLCREESGQPEISKHSV